ncbi:MAG: chromate reductase, NAD(P)H dehydrogenase (quinone) [Methyloprofundus sp.]|nr:MAG: chromate reductase, NAD(P)H dehydrogenase (quinone) [Methyloprofundus sp.]
MSKILAFSGSSRRASFNQQLVTIAASGASQQGAKVTIVNLADFSMPIFNEDLEQDQGMPESTQQLKKLMLEHDGLLIASPEYNSAFTPLLKNAIDWVSRAEAENEAPLAAYHGKTAAIMATSPGPLGGLRGLVFLRMLLANMGVIVLPDQLAIPQAYKAFNENGSLIDAVQQNAILSLGSQLASTIDKLNT